MIYEVNGKKFTNFEEAKKYEDDLKIKGKKKAEHVQKLNNKLKELEQNAEKIQEIIRQHANNLNKINSEIAKTKSELSHLTDSTPDFEAIEEFFRLFI